MRRLVAGFAIGIAITALAEDKSAFVHSIHEGNAGAPYIVKLRSGRVEFVEQDETERLAFFRAQLATNRGERSLHKTLAEQERNYEPSTVPDSEISVLFNRMNPYMRRKSECSDRAHVWAWDEFQRSGLRSEKAFLFLTDAYIRRHRYKWWFHVAPIFTTVSGKKLVMDFQFFNRPVTYSEWKNALVFSKRECVTNFSFQDYDAGADQSQDCYIKFEPMYYHIPGDIRARELGRPRTSWNNLQVSASRGRAFFREGER